MNTYIFQFISAPSSIKYFVKHCLGDDISREESLPFSPKTYQNGENSPTADNSTMTDLNGKVSIHLGSS
jgi:hypothetical protein